MSMTTLILLSCAVAVALLCYLVQYYQIKSKHRKLSNAALETFIRELGKEYRTRPLSLNHIRCKWIKPLYIVRANFDRNGKQVTNISIAKRRLFRQERKPSAHHFDLEFGRQLENEAKIS